MTLTETKALAAAIAAPVREAVDNALAPLAERLGQLEARPLPSKPSSAAVTQGEALGEVIADVVGDYTERVAEPLFQRVKAIEDEVVKLAVRCAELEEQAATTRRSFANMTRRSAPGKDKPREGGWKRGDVHTKAAGEGRA